MTSTRQGSGIDQRPRDELIAELVAIYALSDEMYCVATADGYFKRVSPAWQRNLGLAPALLTSQPWLDFVHPEDRSSTIEAARRLTSDDLIEFENRYRHADGSYRRLRWKALRWSGGLTYALARVVG